MVIRCPDGSSISCGWMDGCRFQILQPTALSTENNATAKPRRFQATSWDSTVGAQTINCTSIHPHPPNLTSRGSNCGSFSHLSQNGTSDRSSHPPYQYDTCSCYIHMNVPSNNKFLDEKTVFHPTRLKGSIPSDSSTYQPTTQLICQPTPLVGRRRSVQTNYTNCTNSFDVQFHQIFILTRGQTFCQQNSRPKKWWFLKQASWTRLKNFIAWLRWGKKKKHLLTKKTRPLPPCQKAPSGAIAAISSKKKARPFRGHWNGYDKKPSETPGIKLLHE